jgi:branched-chain amino acid transport system ATP-binding protein
MVREVERLVGSLKSSGTPVLLVEQQLAFVLRYAERVYITAKGQIVYQCTAAVLAADDAVKARYLGV